MTAKKSSITKLLTITLATMAVAACGGSGSGTSGRDNPLGAYQMGEKGAQAATVNRFLWAASLETLDFLPIFSADPIAGLIITEWYQNPEAPQERFKVNVYILDTALRADALRVSVFRQEEDLQEGAWRDAAVNPATAREIENAILTRARELRLNAIE